MSCFRLYARSEGRTWVMSASSSLTMFRKSGIHSGQLSPSSRVLQLTIDNITNKKLCQRSPTEALHRPDCSLDFSGWTLLNQLGSELALFFEGQLAHSVCLGDSIWCDGSSGPADCLLSSGAMYKMTDRRRGLDQLGPGRHGPSS